MYFVDCPALFDRSSLYTTDPDEHRRFLLFTRAALDSCRRLEFAPDIFHCNDWHTAFAPLFLKTLYHSDDSLSRSKSLMTIHNIGYQGIMASSAAARLGIGQDVRVGPGRSGARHHQLPENRHQVRGSGQHGQSDLRARNLRVTARHGPAKRAALAPRWGGRES